MKNQILLITASWCPHCGKAKEILKKDIASGKIKVIDVDKNKIGEEIAKILGINAVPTFVVANEKGEACVIDDNTKKPKSCKILKDKDGCIINPLTLSKTCDVNKGKSNKGLELVNIVNQFIK